MLFYFLVGSSYLKIKYIIDAIITITIPNTVTNVGTNVFSGCSNLLTVIMLSNLVYYNIFNGVKGSFMQIRNFITNSTPLPNDQKLRCCLTLNKYIHIRHS